MLRDPMISSRQEDINSNLAPYDAVPAIEYVPALYVNTNEFHDLDQINSEDLVPLNPHLEASQSLSHLIDNECNVIHHNNQVLPDLEEHDKENLKFELNLEPQQKGKVNWFYSKDCNKVYIKLNEIFNVEVIYTPRSLNEKLFMRAMMVFNSEVSEPVVRCENHSSKDPAEEKNIKHSVLRCENSNVIYQGTVDGKNISDRLSVRIPLGCIQPNEDNFVKQTVALKFVCQNSCVGRRETSIIFYLENANGEILSKRITSVKICSCPKRDMKKDGESQMPKKRSRKDECPVGKKILKVESDIKIEPKQEEDEEEDTYSGSSETSDIVETPTGVQITMKLPDYDAANHAFGLVFDHVAGLMAMNPEMAKLYSPFIRALKKSVVKSKRLLDQHK